MNTAGTPLNPQESRDAMLRGIKRRLIGPDTNSASNLEWPGPNVTVKVVDSAFSHTGSYPYGPWGTPASEEVLPRSPLFVYPMANLGPEMSKSVAAELAENDERILFEASEDEAKGGNDPLLNVGDVNSSHQGDGDDDVPVADTDDSDNIGAAQQSVGVSIRVPAAVEILVVTLSGGVYEELAVQGQPSPWWKRRDHSTQITVSAGESSSHNCALGAVAARIGVDVRPQPDGSRICTVWARNSGKATTVLDATKLTLFQTRLSVAATSILPYEPLDTRPIDSLDLLYGDITLNSVGHGCDSVVEIIDDLPTARTEFLPVVDLPGLTPDIKKDDGSTYAVGMLDLAEMNQAAVRAVTDIIDSYRDWIAARRAEIANLDPRFFAVATANIDHCDDFLRDIESGWALVNHDPVVQQALRDASMAMNQQRIASNGPVRPSRFRPDGAIEVDGVSPHVAAMTHSHQSTWRPFQIAFILSSLEKIVAPELERRHDVDVIWMPTGGGKTEAYLGLSAFTILWEKATQVMSGATAVRNSKVFMRYTLRLLTVQQITRAASLICALELLRRENVGRYGTEEIRIGAWLGSSVTANWRTRAVEEFKKLVRSDEPLMNILRRCPWCGAAMGATSSKLSRAIGYRIVSLGNVERIQVECPDANCPFSHHTVTGTNGQLLDRGIPLFEVDEDVYSGRPDFIVGTIDKVARIGWVPMSQRLFGLHNGNRTAPPPSLFIQDELHLIAGPLGSIDGPFEAMLEHLCEVHGGKAPVIVAATATTKNFENQVTSLYGRSSRVVPPPGLTISDSFFAKEDQTSVGKFYVGVSSTSNFTSASKLQSMVLALLAHQAAALEDIPANPDPYWSNVVFFSSRRSLGLLTSAVETTFRSYLNLMHALSGIKTGSTAKDGSRYNTRSVGRVRELTATSSEDVSKVLDDLAIDRTQDDSIGLCFATSMVEVGLDVPRLGLMTVMGQPKSASQYIQVTGRVGRNNSAPGLVVTVLNSRVPRDRAHYEDFRHWHERLYASVESTSVTPFTARALERSMASVIVAMCRILGTGTGPQDTITSYWTTALQVIQARAAGVDPRTNPVVARVAQALKIILDSPGVAQMKWTNEDDGSSLPFIYSAGSVPVERLKDPRWEMLNSMRSVDQDANVKAIPGAFTHHAGGGAPAGGSPAGPQGPPDEPDEL